ncbi:hypothetical protein PTMSG1_09333 [Pyrenophora teres f. maculata]|nr:hypothetical protein PTMSG1_09333 [Pyrenophora teres f. maculata]
MAMEPSSLSIILPTASPTGPQGYWNCALSAYSPFFLPPKPTGDVSSAMDAYGDKLLETCTELRCPFPDAKKCRECFDAERDGDAFQAGRRNSRDTHVFDTCGDTSTHVANIVCNGGMSLVSRTRTRS